MDERTLRYDHSKEVLMASPTDGRMARGARSRSVILDHARRVAANEGLDGVSFARIAGDIAMSKSGVAALFGSKESLQLATVAAAREVFIEEVVAPALQVPSGMGRLETLIASHLEYSRRRRESGGCFFSATSAEFSGRDNAVRDAIAAARVEWDATLERVIASAASVNQLPPETDVAQLAFQIRALLECANTDGVRLGSDEPFDRARGALRSLIEAYRTR